MSKKHDLEEILKVGDQLFRLNGYNKTGTNEILSKTGFPRSSFYHHFNNKEGFAIKTLEYYGQGAKKFMQGILLNPEVESPLEALKSFFFQMVEHSNMKEYKTCCLIQKMSIEESGDEGPIQEMAKVQYQSWVEVVQECVEKGQKEGQISSSFEAQDIVHLLFSVLYGMFAFTRLTRDKKQFGRVMKMGFTLIEE